MPVQHGTGGRGLCHEGVGEPQVRGSQEAGAKPPAGAVWEKEGPERGRQEQSVPDTKTLGVGGLVDGQERRMRDSLESPNLDVKKARSPAFKNQCNDRGHFQDFCTRKKPRKMSEGSKWWWYTGTE